TNSGVQPTSAALILRRPALRERRKPLVAVLAVERDLVALALDREPFFERPPVTALDRRLRARHRQRPAAAELRDHAVDRRAQLIARHDLVDEPDLERARRGDAPAEQDHLLRARLADQPREPLRSA